MVQYKFSTLKNILSTKIQGKSIWKKRIQHQTAYMRILEEVFDSDITTDSYGFYPGRVYFATPLTSDPSYTKSMMPVWKKIMKVIEQYDWDVYSPFLKTDPHAKRADTLDSYQIRDLDHMQVMQAEVALMDLNRPSHGVGQEIEMSVFLPTIGFSQARVSRMTKGMPGMLIFNYKDDKELLKITQQIFERTGYKKEPFYLAKCPEHPTMSIFKGKNCLHCTMSEYLHTV